ncbi:acyltransferase [Leucobacter insecticola]|uniref:Acyltransferase n=1 Tax=Leucobacter insecticola TaxID=2714934 RepID=A0A6G8FHL8_9MICO|nr:acyltransferase family protein [Leucobacter insecticola]QIM15854.1 acyltransferase [Leucobacter insecticola]
MSVSLKPETEARFPWQNVATAGSAHASDASPYRNDIDGLRAVAVLLVVSYHVWLDRVSGGVDAFLMISAYFLAATFIRRLESGAPLRIVGQWIHTFKRLLPTAAVVLVAVIFAGWAFLPVSRLVPLWSHTWAALFYSENWLLAFESVDYYANHAFASPVQHFWSLSVQGQVFLLWPLLFGVIAILQRLLKIARVRLLALGVFSVVFALSLAFSIVTTASHQEFAYFDTRARLWEFAAGSILAIVIPWIRLPRPLLGVLGWLGLAALLSCGMILDVSGGFPGYLALWPVLSVAAIIVSGNTNDTGFGPAKLLQAPPLLFLGKSAYALYLVHWPLLVITLVQRDGKSLNAFEGLMLILVSIVLAVGLTWAVDERIRNLTWANKNSPRGLLVIGLSILLVAVPTSLAQHFAAVATQNIVDAVEQATPEERLVNNPGALSLLDGWNEASNPDAPLLPLATQLEAEWGTLAELCADPELPLQSDEMRESCNQNSVSEYSKTVLVTGDSHSEQWLAPLDAIAEEQGWRLIAVVKGGCAFGLVDPEYSSNYDRAQECLSWNEDLLTFAEELQPDLVVTVGTAAGPTDPIEDYGQAETVVPGIENTLDALADLGIPTVLLRDNPRFTFNMFMCTEEHRDTTICDVERDRALADQNPAEELVGSGVATIDMNDFICPQNLCPAVIGNVVVYLDDNHLTSTYTATMRAILQPRLLEAIDSMQGFVAAGPQLDLRGEDIVW